MNTDVWQFAWHHADNIWNVTRHESFLIKIYNKINKFGQGSVADPGIFFPDPGS